MTLAIIGLGLIGTSVALAARRGRPEARIVGIDRAARLLHPAVTGVCDLASPDYATLAGADIVVLAMPVEAILTSLPTIAPLVAPDTLVVDVGSTKRSIVDAARRAGLTGFVGGHPMAGSEQSGPDAARADLFDGRAWFLTTDAAPRALARAEAFVGGLGARPVPTDAVTHDRVMAAVSHLPQVAACALLDVAADAAGPEGLPWAGAGLRDTTRLAGSSGAMWSSVLKENADEVAPLLRRLGDELRRVADALDDTSATTALFDRANRQRERLP